MSVTTTSQLARRPEEAAIAEGNLAEHPLFVLTNKEAKPKDKAAYTKLIPLGTVKVGPRDIERSVELNASTKYGYPTTFGYRILLALIELARDEGFASPTVRTSRHQIASLIGISKPNKDQYEDIENACQAMAAMFITFRGTWYDRARKARSQDLDGFHLLERVQFRDERQPALPGFEGERESGFVTLGSALFESLRAGYFNGVDLAYINALSRSSLAQLLYTYLTKKDNQKRTLTRSLKELGMRFNLKKRAKSALYDAFAPALDLLATPLPVGATGRPTRFLDSWSYDKDAGQVTVVFFQPNNDPPPTPDPETLFEDEP